MSNLEPRSQFRQDLVAALKATNQKIPNTIDPQNSLYQLRVVREMIQEGSRDTDYLINLTLNLFIDECLESLGTVNSELEMVLRHRFTQGHTMKETVQKMGWQYEVTKNMQKKAIDELAQIVHEREQHALVRWEGRIRASLAPRTYDRLFGVDTIIEEVVEQLATDQGANVINLFGLGGNGKTSVALAAIDQLLAQNLFEDVIWVTMDNARLEGASQVDFVLGHLVGLLFEKMYPQQQQPTQIDMTIQSVTYHLQSKRCLVVIDNIESQLPAAAINQLARWTAPSRILLTSRLYQDSDIAIRTIPIPELKRDAAREFVEHEMTERRIQSNVSLDETFETLYAVVSGNPYALKLVVKLLRDFTVEQIADDFAEAKVIDAQDMYLRIFKRMWGMLTPSAQQLLITMATFSVYGATTEELEISGLAQGLLRQAIRELRAGALLESRQTDAAGLTYYIHSLTRSFTGIVAKFPKDYSNAG